MPNQRAPEKVLISAHLDKALCEKMREIAYDKELGKGTVSAELLALILARIAQYEQAKHSIRSRASRYNGNDTA